ncbi:MAG: ISAzo13 family transposase [Planctomycetaceae bacterium]|nr:ISAzo13 family transposase [Planctomycetaceae bacterium]
MILAIRQEFQELAPLLDERRIRLWCAGRARAYNREHGRGGVMLVHHATGVSRRRIYAGIREITEIPSLAVSRVRQPGGGRKCLVDTQPGLRDALERLVGPMTRGDPESPLRWVSKSSYHLRDALQAQGYHISQRSIGPLLDDLGYSLQAPSQRKEGGKHSDRDAQFQYIATLVHTFHWCGWPTLSIDAKKKEKIGDFTNAGREYRPKGQPVPVRVYDFVDKSLGKVTPYGIYDRGRNEGFVNVGISADTAEFAVNSLRKWWYLLGRQWYPLATAWLLTADGGGSNSSRTRLWKTELQRLASEVAMTIYVCHYPPGTSKWNPIEHRMFSHISENWRGEPLTSREVVVNRIANTKTATGLTILAQLDERIYQKRRKISDDQFAAIHLERATFHGEWNYRIRPD